MQPAGRRLPAARLPHQPERLAPADREADARHGLHRRRPCARSSPAADREVLDQVVDLEHRRPSPTRRRRRRRLRRHGRHAAPRARSRSDDARRSGTRTRWSAPTVVELRPLRRCTRPGTSAYGHRGWNAQPGGRQISDGGWPSMRCSRSFSSTRRSSARQRRRAAPRVYGWRGLVEDLVDRARARPGGPAYITSTRSATPATTPRSWVISMIDELRAVLDALEHLEHLGLDRHVERGRRLVGDEQRRARWRSPSRSSPAAACRRRTRAGTGRPAALGFGMPTMSSSSITRVAQLVLAACRGGRVIASAIWSPTL